MCERLDSLAVHRGERENWVGSLVGMVCLVYIVELAAMTPVLLAQM
jgi:hypothetical protein